MNITESDGMVKIDGFELDGEITPIKCKTCTVHLIYHYGYDSYFCPQCNCWTESQCKDPTCFYCAQRPATPLPQK